MIKHQAILALCLIGCFLFAGCQSQSKTTEESPDPVLAAQPGAFTEAGTAGNTIFTEQLPVFSENITEYQNEDCPAERSITFDGISYKLAYEYSKKMTRYTFDIDIYSTKDMEGNDVIAMYVSGTDVLEKVVYPLAEVPTLTTQQEFEAFADAIVSRYVDPTGMQKATRTTVMNTNEEGPMYQTSTDFLLQSALSEGKSISYYEISYRKLTVTGTTQRSLLFEYRPNKNSVSLIMPYDEILDTLTTKENVERVDALTDSYIEQYLKEGYQPADPSTWNRKLFVKYGYLCESCYFKYTYTGENGQPITSSTVLYVKSDIPAGE